MQEESKYMKHVAAFSIEFEGGYKHGRESLRNIIRPYGFDAEHDCTVEPDCGLPSEVRNRMDRFFTSYRNFSKRVDFLWKYFRNANSSMGMHIHVSFKKRSQAKRILCNLKFHKWFIEEVKKSSFYSMSPRLRTRVERGTNYCKTELTNYDIREQLDSRKSSCRYRHINFCIDDSYHTIEFRLWPAERKISLVKKFVKFNLSKINEYMDKCISGEMVAGTLPSFDEEEEEEEEPEIVTTRGRNGFAVGDVVRALPSTNGRYAYTNEYNHYYGIIEHIYDIPYDDISVRTLHCDSPHFSEESTLVNSHYFALANDEFDVEPEFEMGDLVLYMNEVPAIYINDDVIMRLDGEGHRGGGADDYFRDMDREENPGHFWFITSTRCLVLMDYEEGE